MKVGYHARKNESYEKTIDGAVALVREHLPDAVPYIALFIAGPRNGHINIDEEQALSIRKTLQQQNAHLIWHGAYTDLPLLRATQDPTTRQIHVQKAIINRINRELTLAELSGADLVIHMSFGNPPAESLANVAIIANAHPKVRLYLEPIAMRDKVFADPHALIDLIMRINAPNVGICIDTAHVWAAGYDLSERTGCASFLEPFEECERPIMIHLNDSQRPLGTGSDKHCCLGTGEIWSHDDGYIEVAQWAYANNVPLIIERATDDEICIDFATLLKKIIE